MSKALAKKKDLSSRVKEHREDILRLAAQHGASNVRLFGSVARGATHRGSDLDLLVDMESNHSAFFPGGLVADMEDLLGCKVHVTTEQGLHWFIRQQVLSEAVPL